MHIFRRVTFLIVAVLWSAVIPLGAADQAPPPILVQVDGKSVSATGLTPGGAAAVITSWRTSTDGWKESSQTWRDARADAGGRIAVTFGRPFPSGALVAVVDVTSGRVQLLDVDTPRFQRTALSAQHFKRDAKRDIDEISSTHESVLLLVVRPGEGAWVQIASDGGSGDDDGRVNGRVSADPGNLVPIAGSPAPPKKIKPKDVVLVMDAMAGIVSSTEVEP